ncbi:uncharacterized protein LOC129600025 [Paramacrobiotus metropolitanus]|uniref:uncharacterized protein LOC129600025 n=1 Tax=Paramacrobiotus metropolitanus TaxID=2943436 RepID=UPI002445B508|nr:uncharacterized protein LOC129600025 [Paramacrobiotus metropolitanus]
MGVGKTCITLRFVTDEFSTVGTTMGVAFLSQSVLIGHTPVKLEIWDTAGQERFNAFVPLYYRSARAAIIVYDITDRESFEKAADWVRKVQEESGDGICMTLVGNKTDLEELRVVSSEEGHTLAESFAVNFTETSAKSGQSVSELFVEMARRLVDEDRQRETKRGKSLSLNGDSSAIGKGVCCSYFS